MKYLLAVELTKEDAMRIFSGETTKRIQSRLKMAACGILRANDLLDCCSNCGELFEVCGNGELCPGCLESQQELLALSRAVERDREASTGENSPAEDLE